MRSHSNYTIELDRTLAYRLGECRHRLDQAEAAVADLPDAGYGELVRSEIDALRATLNGQPTLDL